MSSSSSGHTPTQKRVAAGLLLALVAALVWLTVASYSNSFTPKAMVTLRAARAGLQMNKGTIVKLRGVDVGKIASARAMPDGTAEIKLAMFPNMLDKIPDNVNVSLEQLTAFGNKAVLMDFPEHPSPRHLVAGDVIQAGHISVEINQVLDSLQKLLTTAKPAEVNAALSAVAGAVDGRGDELGQMLTTADEYLTKINRDLPTLHRDFSKGSQFLTLYGDVMPDLLTTLSNVSATADTVSTHRDDFAATLTSVAAASESGGRFLALNGDQLAALLQRSTVTTELLAKYSPEYACLLKSQDWYQRRAQAAYGGEFPGVHVMVPLEQGTGPYKNPSNLPNITAHSGPHCYGMPDYHGGPLPQSALEWSDPSGPNPWPQKPQINNQPLAIQLFGPLAELGRGQ